MENYFYRKLVFAKSKSSGTSNYADLSNKPQINGVTLDGNKTSEDLGIEQGKTYTAGTNIEITEDNVINNTIPYNSNYKSTPSESVYIGETRYPGNKSNRTVGIGIDTNISSENSVVLGCRTAASNGFGSVCIGYGASATVGKNIAIGYGASSNHERTIVLGLEATTTKDYQFVLGSTTYPINEMKVVTSDGDKYIATTDQTVPAGGTKGQVLMKNSDADYDFGWTSLADYDEVSF